MFNDNNVDTLKNWLVAIAVIFILFASGVFLGVLNIQEWDLEKKYKYGTKALTAIGTIFGGIAVFINAFFAAQRAAAMNESAKAANASAEAANKNAEAALKNTEIALKNAQISEDKQITERFSKAIEQLGSDKIEVRLGAIYTLERIAKDSSKDQWTIMEVLTAFVRQNAPLKKEEKSQDTKPLIDESRNLQKTKEIEEQPEIRLDIQECLTVIGRREHDDPPYKRLNLSNINISKANLIGANLKTANLEGSFLQHADLQEAKLQGADLREAKLQRAFLFGAKLQGADLGGAELQFAFLSEAKLQDAFLFGAKLQGADLQEAKLQGADLERADLKGANLEGADLKGANLKDTHLKGAKMPDGLIHD